MFYLINKKEGLSSFKAIKEFAKEKNIKKIGHTGTLDPMASGLLLVATDDDTKLINYIDKGFKTYITRMKLGYKSDTYDSTGIVEKINFDSDENQVISMIKSYEKTYDQIPPIFSAKKVNGKRSYELAREGKVPILKSSKVKIKKIENIKKISNEEYEFELTVSRGTYIRSIIHDIGTELNSGAIMTFLIRNKISHLTLDDVEKDIDIKNLLTIETLKVEDITKLLMGKEVIIFSKDGMFAVEYKTEIVGIIEIKNKNVFNRKLFGKKCERILNESS